MADDVDCSFSVAQAGFHVMLKPGVWIPGIRTPHVYQETWRIDASSDRAFKDIIGAIEDVAVRCRLRIRCIDDEKMLIRVMSFTKRCSWVDVLEFQFDTSLVHQSDSSSLVHVRGFSTGILPAWIPGSFIWNCLLCWIPFSDNGINEHRIMSVRDAMENPVDITSKGRAC